ncbi:MAG: GAF domain-containing protein [Lautropia sp.]
MTEPALPPNSFLSSGGVGKLIAAHDWARTALGPLTGWPSVVRSTVGLILRSPVPIVTLWGSDGVMIYNDAYSVFAGERHPRLLGSKVREGWPEVADFNDHVMRTVLGQGRTLTYLDQQLSLQRRGRLEPAWMNLDYSPIPDERGEPAGVMAIVVETTAKVLAERQASGERARLERMFEQAPGLVAILNGPLHTFTLANAAYRELVGDRPLLGLPIREALPEVAEQGFIDILDRCYRTGEPHVGHGVPVMLASQPNAARRRHLIDFVFQPIRSPDGTLSGIFVQGHDVTEQAELQQLLRRDARILAVINRTGAAIAAELDLDRIVQMVTDAGVELSGAQFGAFFYNVLDSDGESYMLYALSGVSREHFASFPMPRATAVFQPTFKGTSVVRSDDILADPRYGGNAPYFGMPKGHLPVRSYLAVPVVSRSGEVHGGLFFGHGQPGRFAQEHETLLTGIAGQAAVAIDNARLFQAANREVAERRRAEEALQALNTTLTERVTHEVDQRLKTEEALRQSQKLEAIGKLTGGVAHDFNNLLQVISGNLHLLSHEVATNPRAQKRIEGALAGVGRGARLAAQLLAFSRRQPLEPRTLNVGRLVAGVSEMLRTTVGEAIEVEVITSGGLWNTFADPAQLENALLNLVINARDAMVDAGKLTIEIGNAYLDDDYVARHADVERGQYVMLAVTDTGTGMPPEIIAQAFEPFFSTKPHGRGTGLGLSMVYGFVKQSRGHVKIYSEVDLGTTVRLYLPREHQAEDLPTEIAAGAVAGGTETILVAEDDDDVRRTVVAMLAELGYRVLTARDAEGALTVVESGVPIDLLFTDVVMPGMLKSPELARRARERQPGLAVLFTSGYTENAIVHGGRLDAGVDLLSKPYSSAALARKVRQVLAAREGRDSPSTSASRPGSTGLTR